MYRHNSFVVPSKSSYLVNSSDVINNDDDDYTKPNNEMEHYVTLPVYSFTTKDKLQIAKTQLKEAYHTKPKSHQHSSLRQRQSTKDVLAKLPLEPSQCLNAGKILQASEPKNENGIELITIESNNIIRQERNAKYLVQLRDVKADNGQYDESLNIAIENEKESLNNEIEHKHEYEESLRKTSEHKPPATQQCAWIDENEKSSIELEPTVSEMKHQIILTPRQLDIDFSTKVTVQPIVHSSVDNSGIDSSSSSSCISVRNADHTTNQELSTESRNNLYKSINPKSLDFSSNVMNDHADMDQSQRKNKRKRKNKIRDIKHSLEQASKQTDCNKFNVPLPMPPMHSEMGSHTMLPKQATALSKANYNDPESVSKHEQISDGSMSDGITNKKPLSMSSLNITDRKADSVSKILSYKEIDYDLNKAMKNEVTAPISHILTPGNKYRINPCMKKGIQQTLPLPPIVCDSSEKGKNISRSEKQEKNEEDEENKDRRRRKLIYIACLLLVILVLGLLGALLGVLWPRVVDCGALASIANGSTTVNSSFYQGTAIFMCDVGFNLHGSYNRTCQRNGLWSGSLPNCTIVDCGTLTNPESGSISINSTIYQSKVEYSCEIGYNMSGSNIRTCQANGEWSECQPNCTIVDCGTLSSPGHGLIIINTTTYQSIVSYECDIGYDLNGNTSRSCEPNGQWNGSQPYCQIVDCGTLSSPIYGWITTSATTYQGTASYGCNTGYNLNGNSIRTCQPNRQWSGSQPICKIVDCGTLSSPIYGSITMSVSTYQGTATYICNTGYNLNGNSIRTCQSNGQWSGFQPVCQIVNCGTLSTPAYGSLTISATTYQSEATYICNQGYYLTGSSSRSCQSNGEWSGTQPTCEVVNCGTLSTPAYGSLTISATTYQSEATYICNQGYYLTGSSSRSCQSNGEWSGTQPTCKECSISLDLVLVLDASGSVGSENYKKTKTFLKNLVGSLSISANQIRVGLVRFDSTAASIFFLNTYTTKADTQNAIDGTSYTGRSTNMIAAIQEVLNVQFHPSNGDRSNVGDAVIILTDGQFSFPTSEIQEAHAKGISTFSIGIGSGVDSDAVKRLSSSPQTKGNNYFLSTSFDTLQSEVETALLNNVCKL